MKVILNYAADGQVKGEVFTSEFDAMEFVKNNNLKVTQKEVAEGMAFMVAETDVTDEALKDAQDFFEYSELTRM